MTVVILVVSLTAAVLVVVAPAEVAVVADLPIFSARFVLSMVIP